MVINFKWQCNIIKIVQSIDEMNDVQLMTWGYTWGMVGLVSVFLYSSMSMGIEWAYLYLWHQPPPAYLHLLVTQSFMLFPSCTSITYYGEPTLNRHWNVSCWCTITGTTSVMWAIICDAGLTLSRHGDGVSCVQVLSVTWHPQHHDSLPIVESSAGDASPALNRHWVSIMLSHKRHTHYLKIVMNIK